MGKILTSHVQTKNNFSDFMTKVTYGQKRHHLVGSVLFDIYDDRSNKKADSQRILLNDAHAG
jgi:hypothetical protein